MDETNSLIEQRRTKLRALREKGIDPFKNKFTPKEKCNEAREKYKAGEYKEGQEVELAGRITAHREMGKSIFIDIKDQSGRIQVYAQKNALGDEAWNIFTHLDLGDFIGVKGTMFTTKTGEISVKLGAGGAGVPPASSSQNSPSESHGQDARATAQTPFIILGKALRPMPEKWHGVVDTEIRYRQRYLDLMSNDDVKGTFLKRSAIVREIRNFFHGRGYVEVETPIMQGIPGGAAAQPFKTFHNALGCEFYLRIALELYHKRLLVGGVDKIFEIGKNFRNEGLSRKHNPEFTMLEAYEAYGDYKSMMDLVEELICSLAEKVLGTLKICHNQTSDVRAAIQSALDILTDLAKQAEEASQANPASDKTIDELRKIFDAIRPQLIACSEKLNSATTPEEVAKEASTLLDQGLNSIVTATTEPLSTSKDKFAAHMAIIHRIRKTYTTLERCSNPKIIDLTPPWPRVKYKDLIKQKCGKDWFEFTPEQRRQGAHELGAEIGKEYEDFEVTQAVFEKFIEPELTNPHFVIQVPKELVPLAKLSPDDPTTVEVFECCINGQEISPGYTEQNDPIAQRTTLEHQAGGEQQKLDEDFLVALEHGMPPAGGIGIGIDRLCMMLLGQESIRDVILFPQMKPK